MKIKLQLVIDYIVQLAHLSSLETLGVPFLRQWWEVETCLEPLTVFCLSKADRVASQVQQLRFIVLLKSRNFVIKFKKIIIIGKSSQRSNKLFIFYLYLKNFLPYPK